jgi:hypothetical protein
MNKDGTIYCDKGGGMYTEKEYTNFVLRFDVKLAPNANNGIALRSPLRGNPFNMMEIQILDNSGSKHRKLKPYQYHGSAYGWAPAKRGFQKPVGEWNEQEIRVEGSHVMVTLNGTVILDVDMKAIESTLPKKANRRHKGKWNETGHLGILGHGPGVTFRNMRIKEL